MTTHDHYWRHATVTDGRGAPVPGRRCGCGMETIGALNANVIRASQRFNDAMTQALIDLNRRLEAARRARMEP